MQNCGEFNLLGADDLVRKSCETISQFTTGLKKNIPDGSDEEVARLNELHNNLFDVLSLERIGAENVRSIGEYCPETDKVLLKKVFGTLQIFGQTNAAETFLEPHEALYLIEMNRLIVFYNSVVMSLEQAYTIFLNYISPEEYFVFASLSKLGYIVKKFYPGIIYTEESTSADHWIPSTSSSGGKRKKSSHDDESPTKKMKSQNVTKDLSLINQLMDEIPFSDDLQTIFSSFSVIELTPEPQSLKQITLKYTFDIYNPRRLFRKSHPPPPDFRLILQMFEKESPEREDLLVLLASNEVKCPIVVAYLDDHLKMSGFLYKFA
ncbi:hypothetical protein DMENIID0001_075540 [Sergentomyia squamirostris]